MKNTYKVAEVSSQLDLEVKVFL